MSKTQKQKVEAILQQEFLGHPSREDEARINNLEQIVIQLAEQIDILRFQMKELESAIKSTER